MMLLLLICVASCTEPEVEIIKKYRYGVIFDANGGEGEMESQIFDEQTPSALICNCFTREAHTFAGWANSPIGEVEYIDGAEYIATANSTLYAVWAEIEVTPEMILVEGGTFSLGNSVDVTLSSFYIGKYEVTQAEWNKVMPINQSYFKGDNLPLERVNWYEAVTFCNALSVSEGLKPYYKIDKNTIDPNNTSVIDELMWTVTPIRTSNGYRLPTEAEWEYAARGGSKSKDYTYAGSDNLDDVAWHKDNSDNMSHIVGLKQPNELGLYDMSGNMFEWCWDWFGTYPAEPQQDYTGPTSGENRATRGGCWFLRSACGTTDRGYYYTSDRSWDWGFRIARSYFEEEQENLPIEECMIRVEGGEFEMVDDETSTSQRAKVSAFEISKYELTEQQWSAVMGGTQGDVNMPKELASWYDAIEFCNALSEKEGLAPYYVVDKETQDANNLNTGKDTLRWLVTTNSTSNGYRLPTESEWEWAARGGVESKGYSYAGGDEIDDVAWHPNNATTTQQIGLKSPNELGLYDMSGNLFEWCWDWYGDYSGSLMENPTGAGSGKYRVIRGGAWEAVSEDFDFCLLNARLRIYAPADLRYLGIRVVRSI